jgi:hypothetical protein
MKKAKKKGHKVGDSWFTTRKVNGKRRRVKVTKKSRTKYSVKTAK